MLILRTFIFTLCMITSSIAADLTIIVPDQTAPTVNARIFAKYLSRYLNQKVIITEVPGAASMTAMRYLYDIAPKDGNTIGIFYKNATLMSVLENNIDPTKFTWLGSTMDGRRDAVLLLSNVDINQKLIIGSDNAQAGDPIDFITRNTSLDIKKVRGYLNPAEIRLAFQRKEINSLINSAAGIKVSNPEWLDPKSNVKKLLQFGNGFNRNSIFSYVPTLSELISEDKKPLLKLFENQYILLRPYVAPPKIPRSRAAELRSAFIKAVNDPEYLKEAGENNIDVSLIDYLEAESIVADLVSTPKDLLIQLK
jgi:hypothetical protein